MNEADYLRLLTRQAEQANDFLSNARKWDRERWVCQRFLEALNVPYRQEDFAAPGEQPPDVLFKGAGFEVFFVLDEGRRLNEEWREELTRRRQARQPAPTDPPRRAATADRRRRAAGTAGANPAQEGAQL
ncbi:DUF1780 domain-containing protein [Pseudomonas aeruginosa]|nr:DUF1780 domain-containing protein [Pseudomonas aeruginosa]